MKKKGHILNVCICVAMNVSANLFNFSGNKIVPIQDYGKKKKKYTEAFTINKIQKFKHKPLFLFGAERGAYWWYLMVLYF